MDFTQFSTLILIAIFLLSTIAIWLVGVKIISAIDAITLHFNLGEAFGGMVFLAVVTNLPELLSLLLQLIITIMILLSAIYWVVSLFKQWFWY